MSKKKKYDNQKSEVFFHIIKFLVYFFGFGALYSSFFPEEFINPETMLFKPGFSYLKVAYFFGVPISYFLFDYLITRDKKKWLHNLKKRFKGMGGDKPGSGEYGGYY